MSTTASPTDLKASAQKIDTRRNELLALMVSALSLVIAVAALIYRSSLLPALRASRFANSDSRIHVRLIGFHRALRTLYWFRKTRESA